MKAEADDLADQDEDQSVAPEDLSYQMRKVRIFYLTKVFPTHVKAQLLRKFHDLMLTPSLLEDEACVICMDTMVLKKCSRLALYLAKLMFTHNSPTASPASILYVTVVYREYQKVLTKR